MARQIVYIFDANDRDPETVQDMRDEIQIPLQGHIITVRNAQWKVVRTMKQESITPNGPIPIYRISLTSDLKMNIQVHRKI
jgi:hypothetical protein